MRTITTTMKEHGRTALFGVSLCLCFVLSPIPGVTLSHAEAEEGGGTSCFICSQYFNYDYGMYWHRDYQLFDNTHQDDTMHQGNGVPGDCGMHLPYSL